MSRCKLKDRLGTTNVNKFGSRMIVDEYNSQKNIWVKFIDTGNRVHTRWEHFQDGNVRNVYDKTVFEAGYLGEGEYKVSRGGVYSYQYITWNSMLRRCYSEFYIKNNPSYKDCSVTEEWLNFQSFAKWYDENFYQIEGQRMELDKDILSKGNKVYSPNTCVFVPKSINSIFTKRDSERGDSPIGVYKVEHKYQASCNNGKGKRNHIGTYSTVEEAFMAYKEFKEKTIKEIANKYKEKIPSKLYDAMISYTVEIND